MNERIKELAEQAGICESIMNKGVWIAHAEELKRFAELVRQDEREACAELCDLVAREIDDTNGLATYIGKAIRGRTE